MRRERAEVRVAERPGLASGDAREDVVRDARAHLLGGRRNAGHGLAVLFDAREIAGDENLGMRGQAQVRLHAHAAGAIEFGPELFAERRCGDAGGPENGACRDALFAELEVVGADFGDGVAGVHFDAETFELFARLVGQTVR